MLSDEHFKGTPLSLYLFNVAERGMRTALNGREREPTIRVAILVQTNDSKIVTGYN